MPTEPQRPAEARAEERVLVRAMVRGDERAFETFADRYIPVLYRFVTGRLRGEVELARDIVQTALVKAIARIASFRGEAALTTWLCAYGKTEIAAHFRRNGRRPAEVEWTEDEERSASTPGRAPEGGPEVLFLREEASRLVHSALDELPPRYSRVLELKYLHNMPVRDIADRMSLTTKAAESLLTRARDSFRETYGRLRTGRSHE